MLDRKDDIVQKSAGNVAGVKTLLAHYVNVIDLLTYDNVLISRAAINVLSSYLSQAEGDVSDDAASEEA